MTEEEALRYVVQCARRLVSAEIDLTSVGETVAVDSGDYLALVDALYELGNAEYANGPTKCHISIP